MVDTPVSKRSAHSLGNASRPLAGRGKPTFTWTDCLSLETSELSHNVELLWTLVAELDAGRCKTTGAHQISNLLENLAPLKHRALLDNVGSHFVQRLLSYGSDLTCSRCAAAQQG